MKQNLILCSAMGALLLTCSCSKKLGQFKSEYFIADPAPLEVKGVSVPGMVAANIPAKFMLKDAKVTVTPVIVCPAGEGRSAPYVIQGENVRANGTVIPYLPGGQVAIPYNIAYTPDMAKSQLMLDFQVDQNGKQYVLPRVKVADGVIATATLADPLDVTPATARDKFQKVINQTYNADIHFLINQANVRASETGSQQYKDLGEQLRAAAADPKREIQGISVSSFASPEGAYDFNKSLAEKRESATNSLVASQLKKDNITEFGLLTSSFTPEDWDGFRNLVQNSSIQDKELILYVLDSQKDPELREKEIRNLSSVFDELALQILPQLRYSRIQASINVIGKTDQELVDLFNSDPKALTPDEILYIATLTSDNAKKMEVYNTACEIYPTDYRTFNNLGLTQYVAGDTDGAQANFEHALRLAPASHEAQMNLGLIHMLKGQYTEAYQGFGAASDLPEASQALGLYYLSQGQIPAAVSAFADAKTNNAALSQILAKDYSRAAATLKAIPAPDAVTHYLTAVLGARTGNENMAISSLRQAIRLQPSMLERAKNDLEFARVNLSYL